MLQLPPPKRCDKIAGENYALTLAPRQPLSGKMFNTASHGLSNLRTKTTSAERGFFRKKLAIDPCCTRGGDLRFDWQIGSGRKRGAHAPLAIFIGAHLDHRARFGVAGHLKVGKNEVVGASIDTVNNRIGRASQFVV